MKIVATIALSLVVLLAALALLLCSMCALSGGPFGGDRGTFVILAAISLGTMIGGVVLIARVNRKEQPTLSVTPQESVTSIESQPDKKQ
jgi:hypothetical protein